MRGPYGERRSRLRFSVELSGTLVSPLGTPPQRGVSVRVREVSFNGLLLELPQRVKPGEEISFQVCFPVQGKEETLVTMVGTVVRCAKAEGEGARFTAGVRLKGIPEGLKEGLICLLPRRAETLFYVEKGFSLRG